MNEKLMKELKQCKNAEELMACAKAHNIELTEAQAKEYFEPPVGELSDDELDAAAGGGCQQGREPEPWKDQTVQCTKCGREMSKSSVYLYSIDDDGSIICESCENGQMQGDIAAAYDRVAQRNQ